MYYPFYDGFNVDSEKNKYKLTVGDYVYKNIGQKLYDNDFSYQQGMYFSTIDKDNDNIKGINCAINNAAGGGFWHNACFWILPTGLYNSNENHGLKWKEITQKNNGEYHSLKFIEMLVRKK